jgi:protein gp37
MAENSKIEWCDHTFNPWVGCTKVSPACDNCYAEGWAKRNGQAHLWRGDRRRTSAANWQQPLKWNRQAEREGRRFRVFCASLADVFDNQVPDEWRADLWSLIDQTTHLDWLILTKRPQNAGRMIEAARRAVMNDTAGAIDREHVTWPWPHVWLGTTVENQDEADRRIPHLLATPAAVHFLSCEPLLGPVALDCVPWPPGWDRGIDDISDGIDPLGFIPGPRIGWVIVGGESGPGARPMHPEWARSLRDQCANAGVPFHFKQHGAWGQHEQPTHWFNADGVLREVGKGVWASDIGMRMVGKAAAGRLLDGREHNGMPGGAL